MLKAIANLFRLLLIARTLARHDALFPLEQLGVAPAVMTLARLISRRHAPGRPGERLAAACEALGPTFIKLGQALSVRSDLVGEEVASDLSSLQDKLPPFPSDQAKAIIEAVLGRTIEELFDRFDSEPIAAASIAQVHFATTTDGEEVAVKVLRPDVEAIFARDLALMYWVARLVERARPDLRRLKPVEVVRTFEDTVRMEMDLRMEAAAAAELAENFAGDHDFHVPRVDWQRTGHRVLTTERIDGISIDEVEALVDAGLDPRDIIEKSARIFFYQVFRDGFFHADMHPGNMFIGRDGALMPVDFGIMGRLDRKTRNYLADMLLAFLQRDYRRVADVHFQAGYVPAHMSRDAFTQACRSIGEPILGLPLEQISLARLLAHLFQVTEQFEMETQPQLLLLQKTMLVAEGVSRKLDTALNMWVLAQPLIEEWMWENRGPQARLRDAAETALTQLERLPLLLDRIDLAGKMVEEGGMRLHPDTEAALRNRDSGLWPAAIVAAATALVTVAVVLALTG
ncbi:MAG: 2-polyprenylphenol 6-hydroxylase [Alphaproteobacteria bacterium]|nr:2-polyprenylphenol 6-hydroxylase [Alphaproteobacteria bacterium]